MAFKGQGCAGLFVRSGEWPGVPRKLEVGRLEQTGSRRRAGTPARLGAASQRYAGLLPEQLVDGPAVVGDRDGAGAGVEDLCRVDGQRGIDRGVEVGDGDGPVGDAPTEVVGGAD